MFKYFIRFSAQAETRQVEFEKCVSVVKILPRRIFSWKQISEWSGWLCSGRVSVDGDIIADIVFSHFHDCKIIVTQITFSHQFKSLLAAVTQAARHPALALSWDMRTGLQLVKVLQDRFGTLSRHFNTYSVCCFFPLSPYFSPYTIPIVLCILLFYPKLRREPLLIITLTSTG